jgi:nucleotide-binding universal stress UspA family protein
MLRLRTPRKWPVLLVARSNIYDITALLPWDTFMFNRIMVAVDGSETSINAAEAGIEIARFSGGKVTVVYVADVDHLANLSGCGEFSSQIRECMLRDGEKATGHVKELSDENGVPCEKVIVEGDPSVELLRISKESNADMIVLGSTGRGGLNRSLLGSVAEKVVRHSKVAITMVPG